LFVQTISKQEVKEGLEKIFARIQAHMKYKRKDLLVEDGHIVTPDFEFWVECTQNSEDPGLAIISHQLTNIAPTIVDDDGFDKVFETGFEDIIFELNNNVDVKDLIDHLEELNPDTVDLEYPADCAYCDLTIEGSRLGIRIRARSLTVHAPKATAPKQLVQSFFDVQRSLGSPVLKAIEDNRA
jgi:hypothetical protein